MKTRKTKRGFTIVELVIVIAVIGVLAAVLIPTFINLTNKANRASDDSLVANLNKALKAQEPVTGKNDTYQDAIDDLEEYGYKLPNLVAKSDQALLWDKNNNQFLLEDGIDAGRPKTDYWRIQNNIDEQKYSIYAGTGFTATTVEGLTVGFDAGTKDNITSIKYNRATAESGQEVIIRTNGEDCVLTIDAPKDEVNFYGFAAKIDVKDVKPASLYINGSANELQVQKGHVEIKPNGVVFDIVQIGATSGSIQGAGATVTNKGYVADASLKNHTSATPAQKKALVDSVSSEPGTKKVGGDYEIGTLEQLKVFRNAVNSGNNFDNKKIVLTKDITLENGWVPISNFSRANATDNLEIRNKLFKGTFDGQNHTISNLNNKSLDIFIINKGQNASTIENALEVTYGLFGSVNGATIKNLKMGNVQVKREFDKEGKIIGDSVGAFVGCSFGVSTFDNLTVLNGSSIEGNECVAGIVGRIYASDTYKDSLDSEKDKYILFNKCVNNGTVISRKGGTTAGIANQKIIKTNKNMSANPQYIKFVECSNAGEIKVIDASSNGRKRLAGIATVALFAYGSTPVASSHLEIVFNSCTNSGTLTTSEGCAAQIAIDTNGYNGSLYLGFDTNGILTDTGRSNAQEYVWTPANA